MTQQQLTLLLAITAFTACGGRAIEDPGSGGSGSSDLPANDPAPGSGAGRSSSSSSQPLPSHALGDCTPGFARGQSPTRQCNWVTKDGICFDDKDSACNCICPTSGNSVCFSGFDDAPGSATLVQCL